MIISYVPRIQSIQTAVRLKAHMHHTNITTVTVTVELFENVTVTAVGVELESPRASLQTVSGTMLINLLVETLQNVFFSIQGNPGSRPPPFPPSKKLSRKSDAEEAKAETEKVN